MVKRVMKGWWWWGGGGGGGERSCHEPPEPRRGKTEQLNKAFLVFMMIFLAHGHVPPLRLNRVYVGFGFPRNQKRAEKPVETRRKQALATSSLIPMPTQMSTV